MTMEERISGYGEEIVRRGNSFTALLELPPPQAMELLHSPVLDHSPGDLPEVKNEPIESISNLNSASLLIGAPTAQKKRKERDNNSNKVKGGGRKKSKNINSEDGETRPYVHLRARRGQATDSHSLAERARREKINARMKFLQELVPGCDKISGTASVLDEIINHVQSLQLQVEFLSMRLAQIDPSTAFNLDGLLAAAEGSFPDSNYSSTLMPLVWREASLHGNVEYQ